MKVAITGGRGFVARHLSQALVERGATIVSVIRPGAEGLAPHERAWGLESASRLAEAFAGCQAVAHCAGIPREWGDQTFAKVHVEGTRNVLAACRQARVKKILLTSFLRARPGCDSPYHESKWEAEQLVRGSGLDFTVLKAGVIYGPGDQLTTRLGDVLRLFPFFAGLGLSDPWVRPLAIADMVEVMLASLDDPRLSRRTFPVVGPERLILSEMVRRIGRSQGVSPMILPVPLLLHRWMASLLEALPGTPLVTRAQLRMLTEGLADATPPFDDLPEDCLPRRAFELPWQSGRGPRGAAS